MTPLKKLAVTQRINKFFIAETLVMSDTSGRVEAVWAARDIIYEATPGKCLDPACAIARAKAKAHAKAVVEGAVTLEVARQEYAADINSNCLLGSAAVGSCAGNRVICGFGGRQMTPDEEQAVAVILAPTAEDNAQSSP